MKFILEINGSKLLLDPVQAEQFANLIGTCEIWETKFVGGSGANRYKDLIVPSKVRESVKLGIMSDDEYGAMVFITKLHNDAEAAKNL